MLSSLTCLQSRSPSYLTGQGELMCVLSPTDCNLNEGFPHLLLAMFWIHQHYPGSQSLRKHLWRPSSMSTLLKDGHLEWIPRAMSSWVMSISKNDDSTSFLGDLLQCLSTFKWREKNLPQHKCFLVFRWNQLSACHSRAFSAKSVRHQCALVSLRLFLLKGRSLHILLMIFTIFLFHVSPTWWGFYKS